MILSDVFDRFVERSPVSLMAWALIEYALPPSAVDALFGAHAERRYTRTPVFSDVVDLMAAVVCKIRPSIDAVYEKHADALGVTRKAVYDWSTGTSRPSEPSWSDTPRRPWGRSSTRWAAGPSPDRSAIAPGSSMAVTSAGPSTGSCLSTPPAMAPCRRRPW